MAEIFRIEIPVGVQDNTNPGLNQAKKNVSGFEKSIRRTRKQLDEMNQTRWQLTLSAIDNTNRVLNRARHNLFGLVGRTWNISLGVIGAPLRLINNIKNSLLSLPTLIAAVGAGIATQKAIINPMKMADELTRAKIGFNTFLGEQGGGAFFQDVRDFAVRTPFGEQETRQMGIQLLPTFKDNPDQIFRTLTAFGDAAALTGAGTERMKLALLGFRQIAATGKLSMEELRQVTENLMVPLDPIVEELGIAKSDLADLGRKGIPAAKAMDAILRAFERPVDEGGFAGGMMKLMDTLLQQGSMLRDQFNINVVEKWGQGLESAALPALKDLNSWLDKNQDTVKDWGRGFENAGRILGTKVIAGIEFVGSRVKSLVTSPEWKNATTFGEKVNVTWDFLKDGFDSWWSQNQGIMTGAFENMGEFLGGTIKGGVMAALGFIDPSKSIEEKPFVGAGQKAGKSFMEGFLEELDLGEIAKKLGTTTWNMVKPSSEKSLVGNTAGIAGGIALGGLALGAITGLIGRIIKGPKAIFETGKGIFKWGKDFKNSKWFGSKGKGKGVAVPKTVANDFTPKTTTTILGPDGKPLSTVENKPPVSTSRPRNLKTPETSMGGVTPPKKKGILKSLANNKWLKGTGIFNVALGGLGLLMADSASERGGAIGGTAGAVLGGTAGSILGPVGTVGGSVLGGFLGNWVGNKIGGLFENDKEPKLKDVPINVPKEQKISIEVNTNPRFDIQAAANVDDVLRIIRSNSETIGDVVSEKIAINLDQRYSNMA